MRHSDKVFATVETPLSAARCSIAASWRRSAEHYGLDPSSRRGPVIATEKELSECRQASERLYKIAASKLDQLFGLVCSSGCAVILTDNEGVILDQRCNDSDARAFAEWGLLAGADWSEKREGTNGIGTCLAENRSVIIHRDQHFFSKNTAMSCIDTPIYGARGETIGALDVSSARADQTEAINKLIGAMVSQTAKQIEVDIFKSSFADARIVLASTSEAERSALLAVDANDVIIGATRGARQKFGWRMDGALDPVTATDIFGREDHMSGFERAERAAVVRALTRTQGNVSAAARSLGIGRATMYRRMKRLGLDEKS
jgi:transcriptional regulator of acetoin/glycerol metabolism